MKIAVDFGRISNWNDFHDFFADVFGFPDWYGRNMNAWIDLVTYINDADDGTILACLVDNEFLEFEVEGVREAENRIPDVLFGFFDSCAFVNRRWIESGEKNRIVIVARVPD